MYDPFERLSDQNDATKTQFQQRRHAVDMVRRFMFKSDEYRKPFLQLAAKARELYNCWDLQAKSLIQRANLRLPYAYLIVQSEIPDIVGTILKDRLPFRIKGRKLEDMQYVDAINDFHSMQIDQMRFPGKFVAFTTGLLIDGTAIAKIPYRYKEQVVTKRTTVTDPVLGIQYPQKFQTVEAVFDGPDFEHVPISDFFPDWSVRSPGDIENMRGCVHRTFRTFAEMKQREKKGDTGHYINLDELQHSVIQKGSDAWAEPYYRGDYDRFSGIKEDQKKKPIELWEYWGLFDKDGTGEFKEYLVTVANGDVVVRIEENFYDYAFKPFAAAVNVVKDGDFYGISELFAVRGLIKEATSIRNARLDSVNLAVNRMYIVDRASGINAKSLYSRPNGIIYTNDMNGIRELDPPELPSSAYNEVNQIDSEIQTTTGNAAGPNLTAAAKTFGRSATGASMVSNISSSRSGMKCRLISDLFLYRMCDIMLMTNAQFVSEDQWVKTSDPNAPNPFVQVPQEAFHTEYDFERSSLMDDDPAQELQRLQQFQQLAQVAEQTQPGTIKWDVVFQAIGRDLLGRDLKRFVRTDEERQQLQMQQLAGQQMVNQQVGQRAPQPNAPGGQGVKA